MTDLLDLNLKDLITISERSVEVYDDRHVKHELGTKLNKPAIVTFYNIKCKNPKKGDQYEEKLRNTIKDKGAEHISYDKERFIWTFRVPNF
jgi:nuclear pore complex protein Nup98-Nup96